MQQEVRRETRSPESSSSSSCVKSRTIGYIIPIVAKRRRPNEAVCAVRLNCCCGWRKPPTRKAVPRTRSRLESTEPRRETWTMRSRPAFIAKRETMSSVTLPKVALRSPPSVSDVCSASCSVTNERRSANGAIARSEKIKMEVSLQPLDWPMKANGVQSRSQLSCDVKSSSYSERFTYGPKPSSKGSFGGGFNFSSSSPLPLPLPPTPASIP